MKRSFSNTIFVKLLQQQNRKKQFKLLVRGILLILSLAVAFRFFFSARGEIEPTSTSKQQRNNNTTWKDSNNIVQSEEESSSLSIVIPVPTEVSKTIRITGAANVKSICQVPMGGNTDASSQEQQQQHVHVTMSGFCHADSLGNMLSEIYIAALRAFQRNATFQVVCEHGYFLDRPYFTGGTAWRTLSTTNEMPDLCKACTGWPHTCRVGLNYGLDLVRATLRPSFPAPPHAEMDDLSIHIRCGDVLKYAHHTEYGYPHYETYQKVLQPYSSTIQTIGIVTTPFNASSARTKDGPYLETCRAIVEDMVQYFEKDAFYPETRTVSIRNAEPLEVSIGRLVHSKYSWCNPSTFCVYPTLASSGQAFVLKSSKLYPFVESIQEPNVHVVDAQFLNMKQISEQTMGAKEIISWLRDPKARGEGNIHH